MLQKMKLPNGEELRAGVTKLERYKNGIPIYGSLADTRMGTNDLYNICKTCECTHARIGSKMDDCPGMLRSELFSNIIYYNSLLLGHFGHIELFRPVFHSGFLNEILRILRCVCFQCSRLLLDEKDPKDRKVMMIKAPEKRFRMIHKRCYRATCKCETVDMDQVANFLDDAFGSDALNNSELKMG